MPNCWIAKHTTALVAFMRNGSFDPNNTSKEYLEEFYEELDESNVLREVGVEKFKTHYQEKSTTFLVDKGIPKTNSEGK